MDRKICTRCFLELELKNFCKRQREKDGFSKICKNCRKIERQANRDNILKSKKKYYQKNKDTISQKEKIYRDNNKVKEKIRHKKYNSIKENREKRNNKRRERIKNDIQFKLDLIFSSSIRKDLKNKNVTKNKKKWEDLVGYTVENLKEHLEKQFDDKMTWENYGSYWHIDHIKPKASFEYSSYADDSFKKCWSLNNLRPLEALENMRKGCR